MDERRDINKSGRINFDYRTNETKYYLLTEGSGYPLADFSYPNFSVRGGVGLVVPERRPKTSNLEV